MIDKERGEEESNGIVHKIRLSDKATCSNKK